MQPDWIRQLSLMTDRATAADVWAVLTDFRAHLVENPTAWLPLYRECQHPPNSTIASILQSLRLTMLLQWTPHAQVAAAAACWSHSERASEPFSVSAYPLWQRAVEQFSTPSAQAADISLLVQMSCHSGGAIARGQSEVNAWQSWLVKHWCSRSWYWLEQLVTSAELLAEPQQTGYLQPPTEEQNESFIRAFSLTQNAQTKLAAPRPLLAELKNFQAGTTGITRLLNHLQQRPNLATAIVTAAGDMPSVVVGNKPLPLKQALLWLGPQRTATCIANASMRHQLTRTQFPNLPALSQRTRLFSDLLQTASRRLQLRLPVPAPLLGYVWCAGLFLSKQLQQQPEWPEVKEVSGWHCANWFGQSNPHPYQKVSQQLAKRWQLSEQLMPLLALDDSPETSPGNTVSALMMLSSLAVLEVFSPAASVLPPLQQQQQKLLKQLRLSPPQWQLLISNSVSRQHCHCTWPR